MPQASFMRKCFAPAALCLLIVVSASAKRGTKAPLPPVPNSAASYDDKRDPAKDLRDAVAVAGKTDKRILLEVGGDWCVYCNIMDQTFDSHPQLQKVRDSNYVTIKVNYSKENPNQAFLSQYPKIADYPHFFVLDSKGAFLFSQPTHPFERGKKYNVGKIESFLNKWARPPHHLLNLQKTSETGSAPAHKAD